MRNAFHQSFWNKGKVQSTARLTYSLSAVADANWVRGETDLVCTRMCSDFYRLQGLAPWMNEIVYNSTDINYSRFFWKLLVFVWLLVCLGPKVWVLLVRFWNRICERTFRGYIYILEIKWKIYFRVIEENQVSI